jgi:hypothetical protein
MQILLFILSLCYTLTAQQNSKPKKRKINEVLIGLLEVETSKKKN